ncbi:ATP-dependent DNA ligase [Tessaracoccus sp. Z1128]
MRPMLATPTPTPGVPPSGAQWVHEVKWDGVRALGEICDGALRLTNRTEGEITVAYPEVAAGAAGLPEGALFDGEVVALDDQGIPSFHAIMPRMHVRDARRAARWSAERPVTFVVFDLLREAGADLTRLSLEERRERLELLDLDRPAWRLSEQYDDGGALAHFTREAGLEGVMSKRRGSRYQPGVRSDDWVKTPHRSELVVVIGGWLPEAGNLHALGALWVGQPNDEATFEAAPLLYPMGRVGSGLGRAERDTLLAVLRDTERPTPPFDPVPTDPVSRQARWVEPMLCVQVRYLNVTPDGALRQPVLRALRPDVAPVDAATAALL